MSMWIGACYDTPEGECVCIPMPSNLGGFESARHNYYGSAKALSLGLTLLPQLRELAYLEIRGAEFDRLSAEIDILWAQEPAGESGDFWRFRLTNLRNAIALARAHGETGYVSIG
jgi:hypothetical protein